MSPLPPIPAGFRRVVFDVPESQADAVVVSAQAAGAVLLTDSGAPTSPVSIPEALVQTIADGRPREHEFLKALADAPPETAVARATIAKAMNIRPERLHTVAMAPFFRRMNGRLPVPEKTLIDRFIERSRTPTGDVSYRMRPEFREMVVAGLPAGYPAPTQS